MIDPPTQMTRMTGPLWKRVAEVDSATDMTPVTPGVDVLGGPQGNAVVINDRTKMRPVYIVGFSVTDEILVRDAISVPGGFFIDWAPNALISAPMFPQYTLAYFVFDIIGPDDVNLVTPPGYQPEPKDSVAILEGGCVRPHRRFRLVAPAAVEDLCEPCVPGSPLRGLPPVTDAAVDELVRQNGGCVGCG